MIQLLKEMILDSQQAALPIGVQRHTKVISLPGKATVYMGVRRSGKSTFMCQIIQKLLENGISRENIVHLNFFDDRLYDLQQMGLSLVLEAYYGLYPQKKNAETVYFFFDEIQNIPNWESFIDRLMRSEKCEIYLTGSSARMLSQEIATQMRGRALSWEVFPFSFKEFLDLKKVPRKKALSSKERLLIQQAFDSFWETGGFPEVSGLADSELRIKIHQEYFHTVLFRDLIERHDISHPKSLIDLAHRLIDIVASLYSINSLTGYLKSLGHRTSKETVSQHIAWLEDAYFLFTVRLFDASLAKSHANAKKIYCIDSSLVCSISSGILINSGHLLENLVFIALRRLTPHIFYFKTKKGKEVDFIIRRQDHSYILIQVCESLVEPKTKKREIDALTQAMSELQTQKGFIITLNKTEDLTLEEGVISILPAWKFALESDTLLTN